MTWCKQADGSVGKHLEGSSKSVDAKAKMTAEKPKLPPLPAHSVPTKPHITLGKKTAHLAPAQVLSGAANGTANDTDAAQSEGGNVEEQRGEEGAKVEVPAEGEEASAPQQVVVEDTHGGVVEEAGAGEKGAGGGGGRAMSPPGWDKSAWNWQVCVR